MYCDESGIEALSNKDAHKFMAIGGVWMPTDYRVTFKEKLNAIKVKHSIGGEFKWQKLSPAYLSFYKDLVDYFFNTSQLRFRAVAVEASKVDHIKFNNADAELGFYKFYYQLLHHWIYDFNTYDIFVDLKVNRDVGRLKKLKEVLGNANLTSSILQTQGLPSEQSLGIQLADVLTGLVSSKLNGEATGTAKISLIKHIESAYIKKAIAPTPKWEEKFNVFKINLKGGW